MRTVLLLVLLVVPASAQTPDVDVPAQATWVGPLLFRDDRGDMAIPTRVELTFGPAQTVTGRWTAVQGYASGSITGRVETDGSIAFTAVFHGGGEITTNTGTREAVGTEVCQLEGRFHGTILQGRVFRFTAPRAASTDVRRSCRPITRLTWYLQLDP